MAGYADERAIRAMRRSREKRYRDERRSGWGRDDFMRGASEFDRFETLTRDLLTVPKSDLDEKRKDQTDPE